MSDAAVDATFAGSASSIKAGLRHAALVRVTHWIATLCFFALLLSGVQVVISHPRFYWGESGNVLMEPLFSLPIPSSRATVPTGYDFVLADQNGWSRYMHFQAAWALVFTGIIYLVWGLASGHFRTNLLPSRSDLVWPRVSGLISHHLRFQAPPEEEAWSYNTLQRLTYLVVVFVVSPAMLWTGLAMSPALTSAYPFFVDLLGGQQTARTLHFFGTVFLVLFLLVHVAMVIRAGFARRMRAMFSGADPRR